MDTQDRRLARELAYYSLHKDEWLREHRAYYVVVKDDTVLDFFPSFEAACRAGVGAWGTDTDFLVRQIVDDEPTVSIFLITALAA